MPTERSLAWRSCQILARVLTTLLFDLKVFGRHNVPKRGGVLIVSNHQSNLDPVLMAVRLDRPLNYIAKSELFEGRVGGWLLRQLFNAFPVRLGAGDVGAVKETIQRCQEGHVLNIYPEGARTGDGEIGSMQRGIALIIRRARVPVVPAVIVGSFEAWPKFKRVFRPWPVRLRYGPPMVLHELQPDAIIKTLDRTLRDMLYESNGREVSARGYGSTGATGSRLHQRALEHLARRRAG
jgi:1-acyl-sn-glycerol-3-phosphate acyltransferase